MPDGSGPIKPQAVPLTHAGQKTKRRRTGRGWLLYAMVGGALAAVAMLFTLAPKLIEPIAVSPPDTAPAQDERQPNAANMRPSQADELPPFQALRREQARIEASDALARFVELEQQLRNELNIGEWAQAGYDAARNLATSGDEAFVAERFDEAIDGYRQAGDALSALIDTGRRQFGQALAAASATVDARDVDAARLHLDAAGRIKPNDPALVAIEARAGQLPEVITRLRTARNHELAGRWGEAVQVYESIRALDGQTPGLDNAIAEAGRNRSAQRLREHLSAGFANLQQQAFDAAQKAFNQALAIDPDNTSALGGLQQIAEQSMLVQVGQLRQQATAFATVEQWQQAVTAYNDILALDPNIQFARDGLAQAQAQDDVLRALAQIKAAAQELSANARYQEALATLEQARSLSPQGPILAAAINEVAALLRYHGTPVSVTLRSDNLTEVLLSNVGSLGRFVEKRLNLRPGAYTLIGSRDGCRDVRLQIRVASDMTPVDIRCREALQR